MRESDTQEEEGVWGTKDIPWDRKKEGIRVVSISALRTSNSSAVEEQFRHALGKVQLDDIPCEKEDRKRNKKKVRNKEAFAAGRQNL